MLAVAAIFSAVKRYGSDAGRRSFQRMRPRRRRVRAHQLQGARVRRAQAADHGDRHREEGQVGGDDHDAHHLVAEARRRSSAPAPRSGSSGWRPRTGRRHARAARMDEGRRQRMPIIPPTAKPMAASRQVYRRLEHRYWQSSHRRCDWTGSTSARRCPRGAAGSGRLRSRSSGADPLQSPYRHGSPPMNFSPSQDDEPPGRGGRTPRTSRSDAAQPPSVRRWRASVSSRARSMIAKPSPAPPR